MVHKLILQKGPHCPQAFCLESVPVLRPSGCPGSPLEDTNPSEVSLLVAYGSLDRAAVAVQRVPLFGTDCL